MPGKSRASSNDHLLGSLNESQKQAVLCSEGPVLVLAGAGSGKTRVLTHRIAYLIGHLKVKPWNILAMTFTNKAAGEMKERLLKLTRGQGQESWIGTFHSVCARILRVEAEKLGFGRNFLIFDREDQLRFLKSVMYDLNISSKQYAPEAVRARIGGAKNVFMSADEFARSAQNPFDEVVARVYDRYQTQMRENNSMDFDDLLVNPLHLFREFPAVLNNYQNRFKYILVDEYQDTNRTQYLLLHLLASKHRNLCVVGDDDQSIYRWRGADIRNILDFEHDYPECKVFCLDQNYRSTKHILQAAHSVVQNNAQRRAKKLWTDKGLGEKVVLLEVGNGFVEAKVVAEFVQEELSKHGRNFSDFAVLYRTNVQSRLVEDALRTAGIPYVIVGGIRFYERKEIKDVLAYLRLICNPKDSISCKRIINVPLRGIGEGSVTKLEDFARQQGIAFFEATARVEEVPTIAARIRSQIASFHDLIEKYASLKNEFSPGELARGLVDEIGILKSLKEIGTEESYARMENVRELLSAIDNYSRGKQNNALVEFLEEVALITDIDTWDDKSNAVTLMTLHSAKGLEFPVVFITGLEEGLFPLSRTFADDAELEEERRLFYVGCTRAKEKLYLSWASRRSRFGESRYCTPSRFLDEIEEDIIERKIVKKSFQQGYREAAYATEVQAAPDYEDYSQEVPRLAVGSQIRHPKFGHGCVVAMQGRGENLKLTVKFETAGTKRLVAKYANLEILS
ncbi:MAG: ATP-dependent helicase [bacterium]